MDKDTNYSEILKNISNKLELFVENINQINFDNIKKSLINLSNQIDKIYSSINSDTSVLNSLLQFINDPDSYYNWVEYCEILNSYFWILPYKITTIELSSILKKVKTEKDFDKEISKFFTKEKINNLFNDIKNKLKRKYQLKFFNQIIEAYNKRLYGLCSVGIITIIDGMLSYYIKDKGCIKRLNMFMPIIEDLESANINEIGILPLIVRMVNNNINTIYETINFDNIEIKTHKICRRNPIAHGRKYSYNKIDFIMLLNTLFYVVNLQDDLSIYKNYLVYNSKEKIFIRNIKKLKP